MNQADLLKSLLNLPDDAVEPWLQEHRQWLDQPFVTRLKAEAEYASYNEANLQQALTILDWASLVADLINDPLAMGLVWRGRANVWQNHDRFEESLAAVHQAVTLYEQYGTVYDIAVARTVEVYVLGMLEHFDEAIELALWIRPHFIEQEFKLGLAHLTANLARVYLRCWRLDESLQEYERAYLLYVELDMPLEAAWMLHDMGLVADETDQLDLARHYYGCAYPEFVASDDKFLLVKTKYNLAQICLRQGQFEAALAHLSQARTDLARISDSPDTANVAYIDLFEARVRRGLNLLTEAEALLNQALIVFEQFDHQMEVIQILLELGQLSVKANTTDKLAQGLTYLGQAEAQLQHITLPLLAAWVKLEQARLLLRLGRADEATTRAEQARTIFAETNLPLRRAWADLLLADCQWRLSPESARRLYQSALNVAGEDIALLAAYCWRGLGRLAVTAGEMEAAEQAYIRAISLMDVMRRSLRGHRHQAGFFEDKQILFEELLAILHAQPNREYQVLAWVERFKARALADLLVGQPPDLQADPKMAGLLAQRKQLRGELDQHLSHLTMGISAQVAQLPQRGPALAAHDAYQTQELAAIRQQLHRLEEEIARQRNAADAWREGETIDPGIVHALLDEQTLFVSYYSVEDQLYALTATRAEGDLQIHPLSVSLAKIDNLWRNTHRQIERRTSRISDIQDRLSYLWQSLIAPLKHRLHNQTHLLILPYRGLYHIPFAGLFDPKSKQYLVECWTVHLAPSMTILEHCQQQIPGTRWPLLIGYPGYPSQPNYLPGVEREIQRVADLFPKADILFGEEATVSDVVAAMPKRSFVHLAGHACYNGSDPLESGMPLAEGRWLRASDLYLQYGHLGGSTVVLSGCDSGRGHPFGGDILGLNSAFLYAGAVGVVAGLWRVDDIATTELMLTFYHKLTGGVETAEALRLAQLELLHSEQYSHPYFWAPFQLNGDSRSLMPLG